MSSLCILQGSQRLRTTDAGLVKLADNLPKFIEYSGLSQHLLWIHGFSSTSLLSLFKEKTEQYHHNCFSKYVRSNRRAPIASMTSSLWTGRGGGQKWSFWVKVLYGLLLIMNHLINISWFRFLFNFIRCRCIFHTGSQLYEIRYFQPFFGRYGQTISPIPGDLYVLVAINTCIKWIYLLSRFKLSLYALK